MTQAIDQLPIEANFLLLFNPNSLLSIADFIVDLALSEDVSQSLLSDLKEANSKYALVKVLNVLGFPKAHQEDASEGFDFLNQARRTVLLELGERLAFDLLLDESNYWRVLVGFRVEVVAVAVLFCEVEIVSIHSAEYFR